MASAVTFRRSCISIYRTLRYSQINKFNITTAQVPRAKYLQNNGALFGISPFSSQATNEVEDVKAEKEVKEDDRSPREKEVLEENERFSEKIKELEDKYKRSLADNENIRTRMRREVSDAKQYGIHGFVKDLVEVADVLEKATESVPKEALAEGNAHLKSLFEGLQMTEAQLLTVLKRHGVLKINPIGEKFNPNLHEALFEQELPSQEPGTVGTVTKVGYKLYERIVRPAMVGVVKASKT